MAWVWLVLAGLLEVVWAVGLKYSEGFTRLVPSVVTAVAAAASFWLTMPRITDSGTSRAWQMELNSSLEASF